MKNLTNNYTSLIINKYRNYKPTILAYGSNCYGENTSDLDVCIILNDDFNLYKEIIDDTINFSRYYGIKVDEEIPHENKLIYTYSQVKNIFQRPIFINNNGEFFIKDIEKTTEFLNSETMRKRLLLNIFTTEHNILCGEKDFVKYWENRAWFIMLDTIYHTYKLPLTATDEEVLNLMYKNPFTGNEGEMYLGYKKNDKRKHNYLTRKLHFYNEKYKNTVIDY